MSQWVVCSPAWWFLYHVIVNCKGPITRLALLLKVLLTTASQIGGIYLNFQATSNLSSDKIYTIHFELIIRALQSFLFACNTWHFYFLARVNIYEMRCSCYYNDLSQRRDFSSKNSFGVALCLCIKTRLRVKPFI